MKKQLFKLLTPALLLMLFWSGCKKDRDQVAVPPPVLNAPELITSMVLVFTDSSNVSNIIKAEFRDPDGPGGNAATKFDTIKLSPNKTYSLNILLLDETKNPIDTVSEEIWKERNDHQFFFSHSGINVSITYLDVDGNGYPVGLTTKWRTGIASLSTSKITLKHQAGTKNGTMGPGETDVEVNYQTKIQ